jgi:SecD/SecF fusion protein
MEGRDDSTAFGEWTLTMNTTEKDAQIVLDRVRQQINKQPYFPSSNKIGGAVAQQTRNSAISALLGSLICIVLYIWLRFQKISYGLAAVVALVHDVLITLGLLAASAWLVPFLGFAGIETFKIGLPVVAAFLTIIGYSLNDTIVLFDRVREIRGKMPNLTIPLIDKSINQTLSRTLLTSLTTLIVVLILYFFGGEGIHTFAFALVAGVLVGTYSSIFIASPALYWMIGTPEDKKDSETKAV